MGNIFVLVSSKGVKVTKRIDNGENMIQIVIIYIEKRVEKIFQWLL